LLIYRPALLSPFIRFSAERRGMLDSIVHAICQPGIARWTAILIGPRFRLCYFSETN